MPKLRPIDFDKIKNGHKDEAKRVITDLMMLTPRGPGQNQKGHDYAKFEMSPGKESILLGDPAYTERDQDRVHWGLASQLGNKRESSWWGYTDEQLYWAAKAMGCNGSYLGESDFWNLLRADFDMKQGAQRTRRARRLANRLGGPWERAIAGGKLGDLAFSCRVSTIEVPKISGGGYYSPETQCNLNISFAAKTADEAEMMLNTLFSHAVEGARARSWSAWNTAEEATTLSKNVEERKSLQKHRIKAVNQSKELQQYIENIDTLEEAVNMYSMSICD